MAPMTTNPMPTACEILMNSRLSAASALVHSVREAEKAHAVDQTRESKERDIRLVHLESSQYKFSMNRAKGERTC